LLHGDNRLNLLRLGWIEARVAAATGEADEAERGFGEVRSGFLEKGLVFPASLVSLDLALLLVRLGRTGQIVTLAAELVQSFTARGVGREAVVALVLLRRAAESQRSSEELEERVRIARKAIRGLLTARS
jgi:hypothetical protein